MTLSPTGQHSSRIRTIDFLRGTAMIIMAIDHVRDYFHEDAFLYNATDLSQTNVPLFFTRWITHFCAPVFMFLAGTSAYFMGRKKTKRQLSAFLLTRGLWLLFVDLFIMTFAWNFDINYNVFLVNVIWAFGLSMIILALLVNFPLRIILLIGLVIVFGHHLLDSVIVEGNNLPAFLWAILHKQALFDFGGKSLFIVYPIIPWVGVMAIGYCLGSLYSDRFDARKRKRILIITGCTAIFLFITLRALNIYGDPSPWSKQSSGTFSFLSFLNTTKYPPSLLFLLMTIGPALLFLAFFENIRGRFVNVISVYGRVPFFYYIMHVFVIHFLALVVTEIMPTYSWKDMILKQSFLNTDHLKGYGFSLGVVYIIWICIVVLLYPLCKWYDTYKQNNKQNKWLSYL
ncbi:MAG TPA: heparan-alpha-glucosaminide N-acetyltransferase domain-containing protein [Sphingobacteriaceae bacterium]